MRLQPVAVLARARSLPHAGEDSAQATVSNAGRADRHDWRAAPAPAAEPKQGAGLAVVVWYLHRLYA